MLKIYHVPRTRSLRPIWLCYELGLEIEVARIDPGADFRKSAEWRAISPAGKVPAMTDGPLTMFESGAMVDYILDRYGGGRLRPPPATTERALSNDCNAATPTAAPRASRLFGSAQDAHSRSNRARPARSSMRKRP